VPRTFWQAAILVAGSYLQHLIVETLIPAPRAQGAYFLVSGQWIVWLLYLPCVVMVLRRPNEGAVPTWAAWLRREPTAHVADREPAQPPQDALRE